MNKERFGTFIAQRRRELGLTQRDLAQALHLTDKAVSKWERGLSYPDVTLLEPLAAKLELTVGELMACRLEAAAPETEKEEPMETLMTISKDTVRRERRRSWGRLAGVLVLLAAAGAVIAWNAVMVSETRSDPVFLKETVGGVDYLYVELRNQGHLLKLKCAQGVDADAVETDGYVYALTCRWNRLTYTGTVTACEQTPAIALGGLEGSTSGTMAAEVFGLENVLYEEQDYRQNAHGEGFLCDVVYWQHDGPVDPGALSVVIDGHGAYPVDYDRVLLTVENCVSTAPYDMDGDGENEVVIRTRWPEKPYTVYDMVDGEITETWPDTVPEEIQDALRCIWEE